MKTYRKGHPNSPISKKNLTDELGPEVTSKHEPPSTELALLLPSCIPAYNMQNKMWSKEHFFILLQHLESNKRLNDRMLIFAIVNILVAYTKPVEWDQDVFNTLVLPEDTKELIMALVQNTIDPTKSTDFFGGKGNGLVVLFHG